MMQIMSKNSKMNIEVKTLLKITAFEIEILHFDVIMIHKYDEYNAVFYPSNKKWYWSERWLDIWSGVPFQEKQELF